MGGGGKLVAGFGRVFGFFVLLSFFVQGKGRGLGGSPSHPSLWACLFIETNLNQ